MPAWGNKAQPRPSPAYNLPDCQLTRARVPSARCTQQRHERNPRAEDGDTMDGAQQGDVGGGRRAAAGPRAVHCRPLPLCRVQRRLRPQLRLRHHVRG
eukprot:scaffold71641_cov48-Phaeocystis_antarctica.AAC.3